MLWFINVIDGIFKVVIAGVVSKTYSKKMGVGGTFGESLLQATTKSLGSITLGSLLISIVNFLKAFAENDDGKHDSIIYSMIRCCIRWILELLSALIEYVNRMAYAIIGMHGTPFFESAKMAYNLLSKNIGTAIMEDVIVNSVAGSISLIIGAVVGLSFGALFYTMEKDPVVGLIVGIIAFIIGMIICSVYMSAVISSTDTILLCYSEDMEESGGVSSIKLSNILNNYPRYQRPLATYEEGIVVETN